MTENGLYFENVVVGQEIPSFQRVTGFHNWNRYAAVNYEFVDIHMDDEAGKAAGYPGAFGMGNLRLSYLHNMLRGWIGEKGVIRRVSCQYRGPNLKNDTMTCRGTVSRKYEEDGQHLVELEVWIENQKGEVISPGSATVMLPTSRK